MRSSFAALFVLLTVSLSADSNCLLSGPMLGPASVTDAGVWLQTSRPCRVQLRYWKSGDPHSARVSVVKETGESEDLIASFTIAGLAPGSSYDYELYLDGQLTQLSNATALRTAPASAPKSFAVAFGSCYYTNDPPNDPPDGPHGGGFEIFDAIAAKKPDLMLWTGDNVYMRNDEWTSEARMRSRYRHDRAQQPLQRLLASVPHFATWDDHDYGPNDSDGTFEGKDVAAEVFRDYWMSRAEGPGVYTKFSWGDAEFFLLDDRYFRTPNDAPETPDKVMLGARQMQWLLDSLRSSSARFKIVVNGMQMLNPVVHFEGWGKFPHEQQRFFNALREQKTEGVVFVSGDRHHTELIARNDQGSYPLYDLTCSPLTSKSHKVTDELINPARVDGTLVAQRNFCTLRFEGPRSDRALVMSVFDTAGLRLWDRRIRASELTVPLATATRGNGFILAGEPIRFDGELRPQFSDRQLRETAATTRAGFVKWAATDEGRSLIQRFRTGEFEITIIESAEEEGPGRAPQPGLRTLLASGDASAVKHYQVILNPAIAAEYGRYPGPALGYPITPVDVMSTAWAAEMLHIDFYSRGIPLPHHERPDFQERWQNVAYELGFPVLRHDTDR